MPFQKSALLFSLLLGFSAAGTILWDGRSPSLTDLEDWSFSNKVGNYQYYIHGDSNITSYVNLSTDFQNPADTGSSEGVKITLDSTAYYSGQTMRRTELIPQTAAAINSGKVYYHFSISRDETNAPSEYREHQICFFESHFTELKSGWRSGESGTFDALLRWNANSESQWNITWEAGVWHNIAYGIDFDANTIEFYHSTGSEDLVLTIPAVSVTASSNGADWHLGVLELARDGYDDTTEDFYFSGVYVESGDVTLSISGSGSSSGSPSAVVSFVASTIAGATVSPIASSVTAFSTALTRSLALSSSSTAVSIAATSSAASLSSVLVASSAPVVTSLSIEVSVTTSTTPVAPTTSTTLTTFATVLATSSAISTTTLSSPSSSAREEIAAEVGATSTTDKISTWISQVIAAMVISIAGEDIESPV